MKLSLQNTFHLLNVSALYQKTSANAMERKSGGVMREPRNTQNTRKIDRVSGMIVSGMILITMRLALGDEKCLSAVD